MTRQDKTLQKLKNSRRTFPWQELCSLLTALGYQIEERAGSRVRFYNEESNSLLLLHKPHPENELKGGALKYVKESLHEEGIL